MEPIITSWGVIRPEDMRPISTTEFIVFLILMFLWLMCLTWACHSFVESEKKRWRAEFENRINIKQ